MKLVEEKFYDEYVEVIFKLRELYIKTEDEELKDEIFEVYMKAVDVFEGITKYGWIKDKM